MDYSEKIEGKAEKFLPMIHLCDKKYLRVNYFYIVINCVDRYCKSCYTHIFIFNVSN